MKFGIILGSTREGRVSPQVEHIFKKLLLNGQSISLRSLM